MLIPQAWEKHLLFPIANKTKKQIPRSARDDIVGGAFSIYDRYGNVTCQTNSNWALSELDV